MVAEVVDQRLVPSSPKKNTARRCRECILQHSRRLKGGNWKGSNLDFVDFVDLVNLFNSAEMHKSARRIKETNHRDALRPCGAQPKAVLLVSLFLLVFLCISAELNKLTKSTKSTKSQLPPSQLPPFTPPQTKDFL